MTDLAPGWYDDGSGQLRWWDGQNWTEHVQQPPEAAKTGLLGTTTRKVIAGVAVVAIVAGAATAAVIAATQGSAAPKRPTANRIVLRPAPTMTTPSPQTPTPSASPTGGPIRYQPYTDARFGFTIQVPTTFVAQAASDNGDGMSWTSPDGRATFGASGSNNVSGDTAASQLQYCRQSVMGGGGRVTYTYSDLKVWACSGFAKDGSIFYDWGRVESNVEYTVLWNYPAASNSTYGPVVTHTVNTFKPGPNRAS